MKKSASVRKRLEEVRSLMDRKGLPHGMSSPRAVRKPLRGVKVREQVFPAGYRHGDVLLEDLHRFDARIFRYLDRGCEHFDPAEAVFLDTETTGLAGGAGTYAFLVGIGFFGEEGFTVRQLLMPDLSEEKALLSLLAGELRHFRSIVTFNGGVFDLPLLQTRYLMKGVKLDWEWEHHLDLLPVSRRLWRGHFESCRLGCLEEEVLGFFREGDIPGYAIPSLYVRFLREQRLSLLEPVLAHNAWDIASLAALAVSVCGIVESGEDLSLQEGVDFESAAKVFASADAEALSLECYRQAFTRELPRERRLPAGLALGKALKSDGRIDEAAEVWEELREEFPSDQRCRIELAKFLEHTRKDLPAALECAVEALKIVRKACLSRGSGSAPRSLEAECERRVERLEAKIRRGKRVSSGRGRAPG